MLAVYQKDFLCAALAVAALKFGDFTLKSGRQSPYFFNAGAFATGEALTVMARVCGDRAAAARRRHRL